MIYPVESLIYGLFFMAALFFIMGNAYRLLNNIFHDKGYVNNPGRTQMISKASTYLIYGWLFLVLALAAGITSSYIGFSDDEIAACEVSIE